MQCLGLPTQADQDPAPSLYGLLETGHPIPSAQGGSAEKFVSWLLPGTLRKPLQPTPYPAPDINFYSNGHKELGLTVAYESDNICNLAV